MPRFAASVDAGGEAAILLRRVRTWQSRSRPLAGTSVTEYKGCTINGLTGLPALIYRPAPRSSKGPPVTRPLFVQAALHAAAAEPRRLGIVASCVVAGAIFAAVGAQLQNPLIEPGSEPLLAAAMPTAEELAAPAAPFEFVAVTIGRNDTLDQIFRGLQLQLSDLAELRSLPDVRKSLNVIPRVVLSTSREQKDIQRAYQLGVNSYIYKPPTFDGLVSRLEVLFHYWEMCEKPTLPAKC
jgi:DNA-binding NarL/FixJ family response regulator